MGIERTTPTIGLKILESGTPKWGQLRNNDMDLIDSAILADRTRITSLENTNAVLPLAIAGKVGHNLLRNNIFSLGSITEPEKAIQWTTQFLNGASGFSTRTTQTSLAGSHCLRLEISNVNIATQIRPYPGMNILDPEDQTPISTTDSRQLTNGFGYAFQVVSLSPNTIYTLSAYGKSEIINVALGIGVHWKLGIVFKDTGGNIINSYFSSPQTNRTNLITTESFARAELSFTTPNLPIVSAEVWLVVEGSTTGGIGSAWIDGVQLEQSTSATFLETLSLDNGNLFVDGDLVIGGNLNLQQQFLFFESDKVTFTGDVQIGDDPNEDIFEVYAKNATFYGPLSVLGNVALGDNANVGGDSVEVTAYQTIFYNNQNLLNPQGGNVLIEGNLEVGGNTILGSNVLEDTVTINAQLVTTGNDLEVTNALTVGGNFNAEHSVILGSNTPENLPELADSLVVNMKYGGSVFNGDVSLEDNFVVKGSTVLGDQSTDTLIVSGTTTFNDSVEIANALLVQGPVTFTIGSNSGDDFLVTASDIEFTTSGYSTWNTSLLDISGELSLGEGDTAYIGSSNVNFAINTNPLSSFDVYSTDSSFSGNFIIGGNLQVGGTTVNIPSGQSLIFGTGFSISSSGEIVLGRQSEITGDVYNDTLNVYAGITYFGDFSSQKKGHVSIGGDLFTAGSTVLGTSSTEDTTSITGNSVNINVGSGNFNIGGGFQNNTYNSLETDHGGVSIDNKGNLAIDGKLTVKGPFDPTQIVITPLQADGYNIEDALVVYSPISIPTTTFKLTSEGTINAAGDLILNDGYTATLTNNLASFGSSLQPLDSFSVYSDNINISGITIINGAISGASLDINGFSTLDGDVSIDGNIFVQGDFLSNGSSFVFGGAPAIETSVNFRANDIVFGIDGYGIGDVTIANDLYVRKNAYIEDNLFVNDNFSVGFYGIYTNDAYVSAYSINFDVASNPDGYEGVERAGFRIGGGFRNNTYNSAVVDHGGVTIDGYGNIWADGSVYQKGSIGFETLTLTTSNGVNPDNPVLTVIDNSEDLGINNLTVDGYGNFETKGVVKISGINSVKQGTGLGVTAGGSLITFEVLGTDPAVLYGEYLYGEVTYSYSVSTVFDIDDAGNARSSGYIRTDSPNKSNLSVYAATVGDGYNTFGDFNQDGPVNASSDPISAAISYLSSRSINGVVFIKSGFYNLPVDGIIIPEGLSIKGEGEFTVLDGYLNLTTTGVELATGSRLEDIKISNCETGIDIPSDVFRTKLDGLFVTECDDGIIIDGYENILTNSFVTDNNISGITINGSNNMVSSNIVLRNP